MRSKAIDDLRQQTEIMSSVNQMRMTSAYREIVGSGQSAVPVLLQELQRQPDVAIMAALSDLTNANPVPKPIVGSVRQMAKAWLEWGRLNNMI